MFPRSGTGEIAHRLALNIFVRGWGDRRWSYGADFSASSRWWIFRCSRPAMQSARRCLEDNADYWVDTYREDATTKLSLHVQPAGRYEASTTKHQSSTFQRTSHLWNADIHYGYSQWTALRIGCSSLSLSQKWSGNHACRQQLSSIYWLQLSKHLFRWRGSVGKNWGRSARIRHTKSNNWTRSLVRTSSLLGKHLRHITKPLWISHVSELPELCRIWETVYGHIWKQCNTDGRKCWARRCYHRRNRGSKSRRSIAYACVHLLSSRTSIQDFAWN